MNIIKSNLTIKQVFLLSTVLLAIFLVISGNVLLLNFQKGRLANQDNLKQIKHSQEIFMELAEKELPWLEKVMLQQNMAQKTKSEVMRYVMGEVEDISELENLLNDMTANQAYLEETWPESLNRKNLEILNGSISILVDIQLELAEITSPTQLYEMADDAFFQVNDLINAGDTTLKESMEHFRQSIVHSSSQNTEKAEELDRIFSQMTLYLIACLLGFFFILLVLQYLTYHFIGSIFKKIIKNLVFNTESMMNTSNQVNEFSQNIAEQASGQAASLEQTSASMEQMAGQTQENAEHSKMTEQSLNKVGQLVRDSNEKSLMAANQAQENKLLAETGVIAMSDVATAMEQIRSSSHQITSIVETINDITHQTKMLATNAAIEAARAGEQGKGFAVVANEVSKLAENSREAAKEIVALVQESVKKTQTGNELAHKGEQILKNILEKATNNALFIREISEISTSQTSEMNNMEKMVVHINTATKEQADGIDQINNAIMDMNRSTQSNALYSERGAYSAKELTTQAKRLQEIVNEVKIHISTSNNNEDFQLMETQEMQHQLATTSAPALTY